MASLSHWQQRTRSAPRAVPTISSQKAEEGPGMAGVGGSVGGPALTLTAAAPEKPSDSAVIRADPTPTPVVRPAGLAIATDALLLDHLTLRPVSTLPFASSTVA